MAAVPVPDVEGGVGSCAGISDPLDMSLVVFAVVLACLFALFTGAMLADQIMAVVSNTTQVGEGRRREEGILGRHTAVGLKPRPHSPCAALLLQIDRMKAGHGGGAAAASGTQPPRHPADDPRLTVWHNLSEVFGGYAARDGIQLSW